MTNRAKEKQAAEKALSDAITTGRATDASSMSALMDELQRTQDWSAGGKYGLVLLALSGAAGANVTGSTGAFVQSAAVNYLQGLGAAQVKQIADSLGRDPQSEAARAALHGIVGCAGAAGQGAACASGALGASAGSILNSLMGLPEGLTPEQIEARRNLVTSLVAGIASVAEADAATAGTAAALETSQNWAQLAIPAVGAAAGKCATTPNCQRAVMYVSDKTAYVVVQMKDGAIYVGTAALVGITAASDAVGTWVSEFVDSAAGRETALPGKPGEVVRVDTLPPLPSEKETFGSEIPAWPAEPVGLIGVPGQENTEPSGGTTTTTPLPEEHGPGLIFNQEEITTSAGVVIVDGKISNQLSSRGWTLQDVQAVVNDGMVGTSTDERSAGKPPDGLSRDDTASVYGSKNGYVVINDRTVEIVQASDKTDADWVADSRIKWN